MDAEIAGSHNWLIISDLHLGEDLKPGSDGVEHVGRAEEGLVDFLDHYAATRLDDRPWKLVVNGDMVDFLSVCLFPAEVQLITGLHPDDHTYGLGARPHASRVKMRKVMERHRRVFGSLARFLGAGNELVVVIGNHDAELFWPEVQQTFRQELARLWAEDPASRAPGAPADLDGRVSFHAWFYFEEGLAWVEHGHQYDPYCSFDTILHPLVPSGEEEIDLNVSTAAMRYVRNFYTPHSTNVEFGFWDYIRWILGMGASRALGVLGAFAQMNLRLFGLWWQRTPDAIKRARDKHLERLKVLASRTRLPEGVLMELDGLRRRPFNRRFGRLVQALMLDRLVATTLAVLLLCVGVLTLPWAYMPVAAALVLGTLFALDRHFGNQRESIYPQRHMPRVARTIRRLVRTPIVVFGHAHEAAMERAEDGWYFNTGTWVAERKEQLRHAFTHLRIRFGPDGPRPELCQWRKGRSLAFHPVRARAARP